MNLSPDILNRSLPLTKVGRPVRSAFSLIELLIVMTLLTLIVFALMSVFSSTQRAFRAGVTQTDVLEGSRATMELITSDLRRMTASGDVTNGAVNFFALDENSFSPATPYQPLQQSLPGGSIQRTNLLSYFFLLGRENTRWIGIGYAVNATNTASLNTLYRFYAETNIGVPPLALYKSFIDTLESGNWNSMSPLVDGVFHLVLRPYDVNGIALPSGYNFSMKLPPNITYYPNANGNNGFYFYGNTIPASVELQLGVMENRAVAHAQSLLLGSVIQSNYLAGQSGSLHVFRQQVTIPNVDRSAYQ